MRKLDEGSAKEGCAKNCVKVAEKIGRPKRKYSKAAKNYEVEAEKHEKGENAKKVKWQAKEGPDSRDSHPGVYCLRTNWKVPDERTFWRTYTMLTELEAVLRSLESELGLRPVYHRKTRGVQGHLFVTVLAYHLVHNIGLRLKEGSRELHIDRNEFFISLTKCKSLS